MKYTVILISFIFLLIAGCSQSNKAKSAYDKGDYKSAISLYELLLKKDPTNMEVFNYITKCQSRILSKEAVEDQKAGKLDQALIKLQRAYKKDTTNTDALKLMDEFLEAKRKEVLEKLVPANKWAEVEKITSDILGFTKDDKFAVKWYTKAIWESEGGKATAKSTLALYKAMKSNSEDPMIKSLNDKAMASAARYLEIFNKYSSFVASGDFKSWQKLLHKNHIKSMMEDIKAMDERDENKIKTLKDYFEQIKGEPAKYGAPKGAEIICYSLESANMAIIHYTFPKMAKLESVEIVKSGSKFLVLRPEDSPIKKLSIQ